MSGPTRTAVLAELAREVRGDTVRFLGAADAEELTWAPEGTSNHVLWHAGHALWAQDALCVRLVTGRSELPAGWEGQFGMGSRPRRGRKDWLEKKDVLGRLTAQLERVLRLLESVDDLALDRAAPHARPGDDRTLGHCILHGWHDEARHQGEMYLLLKMRRLGPAQAWGEPPDSSRRG